VVAVVIGAGFAGWAPVAGAADLTVCRSGSLPHQRTDVDADIPVAQFDPALGTLNAVSVATQTAHLDTDGRFENTAATPERFNAQMQYTITFTNHVGLPAPSPITGTIQRVSPVALATYDGAADFQGPDSVSEPSTTHDAAAVPMTSSDPVVLAALTGSGTVSFHVLSAIAEITNGGGGNIATQIDTFVAAEVQVCFTYSRPTVATTTPTVPTTTPTVPTTAPTDPVATAAATAVVTTPRFTG
jgi:hypothetical protein